MSTFKKKETIINFEKYLDKKVYVKFNGGREVIGILKGYDSTINLVFEECVEYLRDPDNFQERLIKNNKDVTRKLGIVVCRGTNITFLAPVEGMGDIIGNPFLQKEEQE